MTHETRDYIQILHEHGYRVTPQRLIVLDAICDIGGHATFGDVYARVKYLDPSIDKSTIYRAIDVLCEVGLVVATELETEGKVYNIAGSNHHHLVCQSCGQVLTVSAGEFEQFRQAIFAKYGFCIQAEHLAFKGLCEACQGDA